VRYVPSFGAAVQGIRRMRGATQAHLVRLRDGSCCVVKFANRSVAARVVNHGDFLGALMVDAWVPLRPLGAAGEQRTFARSSLHERSSYEVSNLRVILASFATECPLNQAGEVRANIGRRASCSPAATRRSGRGGHTDMAQPAAAAGLAQCSLPGLR
jgi:hypothetical protein